MAASAADLAVRPVLSDRGCPLVTLANGLLMAQGRGLTQTATPVAVVSRDPADTTGTVD